MPGRPPARSFSRANILADVQHCGIMAACRATAVNLRAMPCGANADAGDTPFFGGWWVLSSLSPELSV